MRPRVLALCLLVSACLAGVPAAASAEPARTIPGGSRTPAFSSDEGPREAGPQRSERGSLLVHLRPGASEAVGSDVARDAGVRSERHLDSVDVEVVSTQGKSSSVVAARLREDPRVERVEANPIRYATGDANDTYFFNQGGLFASRLPAAWDVTHGVTTTDIAILDTGVDLDHPDLVSRIGAKIDIVNGDSNPQDDEGHGTFVAGVAAADTDNAKGIAGAAWDARIMPVKVLGSDGSGSDGDIAAGIEWATDNGAEIINLSLGGPGASQTLGDAVAYALVHSVTVIAASGNESTDVPSFPAAYGGVLSVGATDAFGDVVSFSNRGPSLDVVAPGFDIISTALAAGATEAYAMGAGTSFSTPLVSGVAALVKAKNPTFTPAQIYTRLKSTAIDRGPAGIDDTYGWGLLDAYAAVGGRTAASPPPAVRDAGEPDGTAADARAIGSGAQGTISPEGDVDWFSVDAPSAGTITVTVTPPASDGGEDALTFDPMITGYSPTLATLGQSDIGGGGSAEVLAIDAPAAGTYRFRVENFSSSRSTGPRTDPDAYDIESLFVPASVVPSAGPLAWVSDAAPAPHGTGIGTSVSPTVTFARAVTEASAESSKVSMIDAKTGFSVAATRTYNAASKTLTFDPSASLAAGRTYAIRVTNVTDGSATMTESFVTRFTTTGPATSVDRRSDFNNDGYEDTVIGAPGEDHGTKTDGGVVHVLYGSTSGPKGSGSQMWSQDSSGIAGAVEAGDRFGDAVATGDLNNDGYDDLIVGAPYEDLSVKDAGLIHVILGSATGLRSSGNTSWTQDSSGIPGVAETGDRFGGALATGTFDGVAGLDVAVGSPGEAIGTAAKAGAVHVLRGGAAGLVSTKAQQWTQDSAGIEFFAEAGDLFGGVLAAGDFHGDGNDDLAIGAPTDDIDAGNEGTVMLMRGSVVGLRPAMLLGDFAGDQSPEAGDQYGASIAIGDIGGYGDTDNYADLIVGIPGQDGASHQQAGAVGVVYSDHSEPWWATERLDATSSGLGATETNGLFGASVAARRIGNAATLVVGAPYAAVNGAADAGSASVYVPGTAIGPDGQVSLAGVRVLSQDTTGVPDVAETNDRFAAAVAINDADGDGEPDLVAGVPFESVSGRAGPAPLSSSSTSPMSRSASRRSPRRPLVWAATWKRTTGSAGPSDRSSGARGVVGRHRVESLEDVDACARTSAVELQPQPHQVQDDPLRVLPVGVLTDVHL